MKRQQPIQLSIPDPCTQSWDDMHLAPGGRHCDHCQKTVVDFTRMTDKQLLDYFRSAGSGTCGRLTNLQIDRVLKAVEVPRKKWLQRVAAGLILVFGLSKDANGQSRRGNQQSDHPFSVTEQKATPIDSNKAGKQDGQFRVHCILVNEKNNPIINANVTLLEGGIAKARGLTDFDGLCDLSIPYTKSTHDIKFSFLGTDLLITGIKGAKDVVNVNGRLVQKIDNTCKVHMVMGRMYWPSLIGSPGQQTKSGDMIPNGW